MPQRLNPQVGSDGLPILNTLGGAELLSPVTGTRLLGQGKPLALLTYLHCSPGRTASRDHLVDLLWADQDPEHARQALRQTVHRIRLLLGNDAIDSRDDALVLALSFLNDRDRFLAAVADRAFEEAVGVYRGAFFEGFATPGAVEFEHWADAERRRLHAMFTRAAGSLTRAALAVGRHREATELARRVRDADPEAEAGWRLLLESLASARDQLQLELEAGALEEWFRAEGREPEPATRALLEMAHGSEGNDTAPEERGFVSELVGRERQFGAIVAAWDQARSGRACHLHFEAPAGLGKTRLLEDAGARLRTLRTRVVMLRTYPGERDLAWSFAAELARGLGTLPGAAGVSEGVVAHLVGFHPALSSVFPGVKPSSPDADLRLARTHALLELLGAVLDEQPVALLLDDLHWLDPLSRQVLEGILDRLDGQPLMVVTTARPGYDFAFEGSRTQRIVLPALSTEQVLAMLASLGTLPSGEWGEQVALALQRTARGSPLLLLETLQRALEHGELSRDGGRWSAPNLPVLLTSLERGGALRHRVAELPSDDRRLLLLLATAGVPIEASELRLAFAADPVERLHRLEHRGLAARKANSWTVAHDEIAETVIDIAGADERRAANLALGRALTMVPLPDPTRMRRAGRHFAAGGAETELELLARRWMHHPGRSLEGRSAAQSLGELLDEPANSDRVRRLLRTLPLRMRMGLDWRHVAVLLVLLAAGALAAGRLLVPAGAVPEAVLGMGILEGDSDLVIAALPVRYDDWRPNRSLHVTSRGLRYRIKDGEGIFGWLAASPDGSRLAYNRIVSDSGRIDIFLREPDGHERRLTDAPRDDLDPGWSPDGRQLVFQTARWSPLGDDDADIAVMDMATGDVRQLTRGPATDVRPVWSPDGTRIGFVRRGGSLGPSALCWVTTDGLTERCRALSVRLLNFVGWAGPDEVFIQLVGDSIARIRLSTGHTLVMEGPSTGLDDAAPGGAWVAGTAGANADSGSSYWIIPADRPDLARWVRLGRNQAAHGIFWWPTERASRHYLDRLIFPGMSDSLPVGVGLYVSVRGLAITGDTIELPPGVVRWRVSDTTGTSIMDSSGLLTVRKPGAVLVVASAGGWRTDSARYLFALAASRTLWEERWTDSTLGAWRPFGDPTPIVVADERGDPAFWEHGDGAFLSGAYSAANFRSPRGIGAEFLVSMPVTRDKWQRMEVGFAANPQANASGFYSAHSQQCSLTYPVGGEPSAKGWVGLSIASDGITLPADSNLADGGWHRVRIQLFPDGTCAIALDGKVLARPAIKLPVNERYHLFIQGQSVGTRMLVGRVAVWEGVRGGVQ